MVFEDSKGWLAFKAALKSTGYHLEPYTKLLGLDGTRANMSSGMLEADGTRGKDNRAAELQVCVFVCVRHAGGRRHAWEGQQGCRAAGAGMPEADDTRGKDNKAAGLQACMCVGGGGGGMLEADGTLEKR
eukprot:1161904-Pelagomonas_calceolata.AAC.14